MNSMSSDGAGLKVPMMKERGGKRLCVIGDLVQWFEHLGNALSLPLTENHSYQEVACSVKNWGEVCIIIGPCANFQ